MTATKGKMKIGFDAKRIVKNGTGLGSYGRTLINSLADIDSNDELVLYAPDKGRDNLRLQVNIRDNVRFTYPNRKFSKLKLVASLQKSLWRSKGIVDDVRRDGIDIFHGLSGELPVGIKNGNIKTVLTIHDLIFFRHPE